MPKIRLQRRALAELGALLLVVSMLSIFCAAKPLPVPLPSSSSSLPAFDVKTHSTNVNRFHRVLNASDKLTGQSIWTKTLMRNVNEIVAIEKDADEQNTSKLHGQQEASKPLNANDNYFNNETTPNNHHKKLEANTLPHSDQTIADKFSETTAFSELNLDAMNAMPTTHNFNLNEVQRAFRFRRRRASRRRRHHHSRNVSTEFGREPSTSNDDADDEFSSTTSSSDYHAIVTSFSSTTNTTANKNDYDKSSTQSVFLDFVSNNNNKSNNFNVAENSTQTDDIIEHKQPNEHSKKMMPATASRTLSLRRTRRTARTLQTTIERTQRKKALRNGSERTNLERIERSANLSLTKTTKRLQLLIKSRLLQLLPDGTVNGTQNDESEYTILQRSTVGVGQIRLIGIATCLYLCMDACGNLYGSREFSNDCVFNERMEDNYNYYTSTHHSTALRTFYVALNRLGGPRVTYLPANKSLAKLSTYVKSFTLIVPEHRSETLIARLFGANHVKHGIKHLCDSGKELMALNAHTMLRPECPVNSQKPIVATKKSTSHNNRNHNHNKRVPSTAPAPLIERKQQNVGRNNHNSCTSSDECPKKKKKNYGRNGTNGGKNTGGDSPEARTKQKPTKSVKRVNKNSKKLIATTTTATTMPPPLPPSNGNRFQSMSPRRWPALDDTTTGGHFDDALSDSSSASIPILSNGHAALNNDDDDDIDYDDR